MSPSLLMHGERRARPAPRDGPRRSRARDKRGLLHRSAARTGPSPATSAPINRASARKARTAGATSSRASASARLAMTKPVLSPQSWRSPSKVRPWKGCVPIRAAMPSVSWISPPAPLPSAPRIGHDLGLEDVAADHAEGRGRVLGLRLLDQAPDLGQPAVPRARRDDAVAGGALARHLLRADDVAADLAHRPRPSGRGSRACRPSDRRGAAPRTARRRRSRARTRRRGRGPSGSCWRTETIAPGGKRVPSSASSDLPRAVIVASSS